MSNRLDSTYKTECDSYVAEGVPPFQHEGHWVEGFTVNPMPIP